MYACFTQAAKEAEETVGI